MTKPSGVRKHKFVRRKPLYYHEKLSIKIVEKAKYFLGVKEYPPESNRGPEVEMFLRSVGLSGGFEWCVAFLTYCTAHCIEVMNLKLVHPNTGSAGAAEQWAEFRKTVIEEPKDAKPGDWGVILSTRTESGYVHGVMLVEIHLDNEGEDDWAKTIEGNEGDMVKYNKRYFKDMTVFRGYAIGV